MTNFLLGFVLGVLALPTLGVILIVGLAIAGSIMRTSEARARRRWKIAALDEVVDRINRQASRAQRVPVARGSEAEN